MYIVDSYIGNDVTVRQGYKTRPGAMRAAKKRFESGVYWKVNIWYMDDCHKYSVHSFIKM